MLEEITLAEAAVEARMNTAQLYMAMTRGELAGRKGKDGWLVKRSDLQRFIASQSRTRSKKRAKATR